MSVNSVSAEKKVFRGRKNSKFMYGRPFQEKKIVFHRNIMIVFPNFINRIRIKLAIKFERMCIYTNNTNLFIY